MKLRIKRRTEIEINRPWNKVCILLGTSGKRFSSRDRIDHVSGLETEEVGGDKDSSSRKMIVGQYLKCGLGLSFTDCLRSSIITYYLRSFDLRPEFWPIYRSMWFSRRWNRLTWFLKMGESTSKHNELWEQMNLNSNGHILFKFEKRRIWKERFFN